MGTVTPFPAAILEDIRDMTASALREGRNMMQDEVSPMIPFGTEFALMVPWQQGRYEATYRKIARRWDEGLAEPYDDAVFVLTMLRAVLVRLAVRRGDASTPVSQASWEQYPPTFLRALLGAIDEDLRRREASAALDALAEEGGA